MCAASRTARSHVLFDFDGVLCDSLAVCVEEYERLRKSRFPTLPLVLPGDRMDIPFSGALKTALDPHLGTERAAEFYNAHSAAMRLRAPQLKPFVGVRELLDSLPPDSVSIVSSAYNSAICTVLAGPRRPLPSAVKHLHGRDTRESKTTKIQSVLRTEGITANEAVYVGDLESDLLYTRSVPIDCVLVTYGYHSREYLNRVASGALALVDSVEELRERLLELMRGRT